MKNLTHTPLMIALSLAGCSYLSHPMFVRPSTFIAPTTAQSVPISVASAATVSTVNVECLKQDDDKTCLYAAVNATEALQKVTTKAEADFLIYYLISLSDANCASFTQRAFTGKAIAEINKSVLSDLTTGGAASTVYAVPGLSVGLSVTNLFVGKSIDEVDKTLYASNTFQALESAIQASRATIKKTLLENLNKGSDDPRTRLASAFSDLHAYDDACSFKAGLTSLVKIAEEAKAKASTPNTVSASAPAAAH